MEEDFFRAVNREYGYTLRKSEQNVIIKGYRHFLDYLKKDLRVKVLALKRPDLENYFSNVSTIRKKALNLDLLVEAAKYYITEYFANLDEEDLALEMIGYLISPPQRQPKVGKPNNPRNVYIL